MHGSRVKRLRHGLFGLFLAVCALAMCFPQGSATGELIVGLPAPLAWYVGWLSASLVALASYHMTGRG